MIAPDPDPTPDRLALDVEQSEAIKDVVALLSDRDRQIVYAFFYDPAAPSYAQIAERLGVSPETVGPLRTRCLRRLRGRAGQPAGALTTSLTPDSCILSSR